MANIMLNGGKLITFFLVLEKKYVSVLNIILEILASVIRQKERKRIKQ